MIWHDGMRKVFKIPKLRHIGHIYHKPAAPAQVRQAHTLQGLVAATEKAALTFNGLRALMVRLHRVSKACVGVLDV